MKSMMQAALFFGDGRLEVDEIPVPAIGEEEVLIRVKCAAVCGTDIRMYRNGVAGCDAQHPLVLGHEISGVIERLGSRVSGLAEGMRVAVAPNFGCGHCACCISGNTHLCPDYQALGIQMNGGFAEYVKVPANAVRQGNIMPLSDAVSFEDAAINEPFSCAFNGFEQYGVRPGDTVLLYGAGPIGLLHIKLAQMAGAASILLSDPSEARLELAKRLIPAVIPLPADANARREAVNTITNGRGIDVCVTACPSPEAQAEAVELAGLFGRVCFFGGLPKEKAYVPINTNAVHYKQLRLTGSTRASLRQFAQTLHFIEHGLVDLQGFVTDRYPLSEINAAFQSAQSGTGVKTVITFA